MNTHIDIAMKLVAIQHTLNSIKLYPYSKNKGFNSESWIINRYKIVQ